MDQKIKLPLTQDTLRANLHIPVIDTTTHNFRNVYYILEKNKAYLKSLP